MSTPWTRRAPHACASRGSVREGRSRTTSGTDLASDPALVAAHVEHGLAGEKGGRQEGQTRVSTKGPFGVVPVVVAKDWIGHAVGRCPYRRYILRTTTMPGPRAKQNGAKKNKTRTVTVAVLAGRPPALPPALQPRTLSSLDELTSDDWDEVVRVMCDHLKIPGMSPPRALLCPAHPYSRPHQAERPQESVHQL